jgi:hypothetical protein
MKILEMQKKLDFKYLIFSIRRRVRKMKNSKKKKNKGKLLNFKPKVF